MGELDVAAERVRQLHLSQCRTLGLEQTRARHQDAGALGRRCSKPLVREDVLEAYVLASLTEVQGISDAWLLTYNDDRPHEALGDYRRRACCRGP